MDFLAKFPRKLAANSTAGAPSYELVPDLYAVHRKQAAGPADRAEYLLNDGKIAVFKLDAKGATSAAQDGKVSAVYTLVSGGSLAVPTGLVFVRFADGTEVKAREKELNNAGYEVTETLAYAPNAAWLQARSEDIADSLNGLAALAKLPNVEGVEPQMLMESARR